MGVGAVNGPAIFLDRDGVLNHASVRGGKPYPPPSVAELEIVADAAEALSRLKSAGYRLVVVTNQPDVARGVQRHEMVEAINAALAARLPIDEFRVCYHDDGDECGCRKPEPGLLLQAPHHDMPNSIMVGDRWRDIEAGRRAGVRATVLIDRAYGEPCPATPDVRVESLAEAAAWILALPRRQPKLVSELRVKLFADGADLPAILALAERPYIRGFTTNPTLMHQAGVRDYRAFAREVLARVPDRPVSFEVFSDEFPQMEAQAREIASWGGSVVVKIPVTNTRGEPSFDLIRRLAADGIRVNVTAVLTLDQVEAASAALAGGTAANISVFAGRIADTGRDPVPVIAESVRLVVPMPNIEIIWASPRELLNVFQADAVGCHIITMTPDLLKKLDLVGKDLEEFSLDTVKMFHRDALKAGLAF